jgi:hypothetical protein
MAQYRFPFLFDFLNSMDLSKGQDLNKVQETLIEVVAELRVFEAAVMSRALDLLVCNIYC